MIYEGTFAPPPGRFALVAARFNQLIVDDLSRRYDQWAERCGVIPRQKILEMMKDLPGKAFWEDES